MRGLSANSLQTADSLQRPECRLFPQCDLVAHFLNLLQSVPYLQCLLLFSPESDYILCHNRSAHIQTEHSESLTLFPRDESVQLLIPSLSEHSPCHGRSPHEIRGVLGWEFVRRAQTIQNHYHLRGLEEGRKA